MTADPSQLKMVKDIGRAGGLFCLAKDPQSGKLYFGCSDFALYELDLTKEKPEPIALAGHSSYVTGVALAGGTLISGGWDGKLIWWDLATQKPVRTIDGHQKWIRGLVASPDGSWIASVADDMVCRRWNAQTGELLAELRGHEGQTPQHYPSMLYACAVSSDGTLLATADKLGHTVIWDVATGTQAGAVDATEMYTWDPSQRRHSIGGARCVAFSADSNLLAVGGMGKVGNIDHLEGKSRIEVFDWRKKERTHEISSDKFKGLVEHVQFHPTKSWLLAAGGDHGGFIALHDLQTKAVIKEEKAPSHVYALAPDANWETIYCAGHGKLTVWEMRGIELPAGTPPEPDEQAAKS